MLYYEIKNYEDFKAIFVRETSDGKKILTNKVVLNTIKHRAYFKRMLSHYGDRVPIPSVAEVQQDFISCMNCHNEGNLPWRCFLLMSRFTFRSCEYDIDEWNGLCADGDTKSVRYINIERDKVFKMKAGKFFSAIIKNTFAEKYFPASVANYFCGDVLPQMWEAYAKERVGNGLELHVDDNFEDIYDSCKCKGCFHSCMEDRGFHPFYENSVNASAAYLTNEDDKIVARAVIFNEVFCDDGETYRLCERQYSMNGDLTLQRILVNKLIAGGHIDGYKQVGAGCHESDNFVSNDGEDWSDKRFRIKCNIDYDDWVSYQDSFKYYNESKRIAYNYSDAYYDVELTMTNGSLNEVWDDYHERPCREIVEVHYDGSWINCDANDLDDFYEIDGTYYHEDEVAVCEHCGERYVIDDEHYSDLTEEGYCSSYCRDQAEEEYKENNWYWSDYDNDYFEDESEITYYNKWYYGSEKYKEESISVHSLDKRIAAQAVIEYDGMYYDDWDDETGLPFGVEVKEEVAV